MYNYLELCINIIQTNKVYFENFKQLSFNET